MTVQIDAARLQFEEALAAFAQRQRLVGTERYDSIRSEEHYRAFAVAGAMKADLLADLRTAVARAVEDGVGIEEFRKDFWSTVRKHGWHGWTGEGTEAGEAWRTRVIYTTNIRKSHSAGRYAQLTEPSFLAEYPYWQWIHSGLAQEPRSQHLAWNGMTLHHSDPFWRTHFPPRIPPDYGCTCRVKAVRRPAAGASTEPPPGWQKNANPGAGAPPYDVAEAIRQMVAQKLQKLPEPEGQALLSALATYKTRLAPAEAVHPAPVATWPERQQALGFPYGKGWELEPHEVEFYERFAALSLQARLIQRSDSFFPTNDFFWLDKGVEIEVKKPQKKATYGIASQLIKKAVERARNNHGFTKENFIIDLGDKPLTEKLRNQLAQYNVRNPSYRIRALWVMSKGGVIEIALRDSP